MQPKLRLGRSPAAGFPGSSWPLFRAGSPAKLLDGGGDVLEPVAPQAEALEAGEAQERGGEVREPVAAQVEDAQGPAQGGAGQALREGPAAPQPVVLCQQRVEMRQVQQLGAQHRQPRPAHVQDLQGRIPAPEPRGQLARRGQPGGGEHQAPRGLLRGAPRPKLAFLARSSGFGFGLPSFLRHLVKTEPRNLSTTALVGP